MADVVRLSPVPRIGDMFTDARGDGRTMRVSLHPDRGIAVVSLWAGTTCRASFQLPLDDASRLAVLFTPAADAPVDADAETTCHPGLADPVDNTGSLAVPDLPQAS